MFRIAPPQRVVGVHAQRGRRSFLFWRGARLALRVARTSGMLFTRTGVDFVPPTPFPKPSACRNPPHGFYPSSLPRPQERRPTLFLAPPPPQPKSPSQVVISRMQHTFYATRGISHGASLFVHSMSAWSVKTQRAPS